jgi:hypothetical protein
VDHSLPGHRALRKTTTKPERDLAAMIADMEENDRKITARIDDLVRRAGGEQPHPPWCAADGEGYTDYALDHDDMAAVRLHLSAEHKVPGLDGHDILCQVVNEERIDASGHVTFTAPRIEVEAISIGGVLDAAGARSLASTLLGLAARLDEAAEGQR